MTTRTIALHRDHIITHKVSPVVMACAGGFIIFRARKLRAQNNEPAVTSRAVVLNLRGTS